MNSTIDEISKNGIISLQHDTKPKISRKMTLIPI